MEHLSKQQIVLLTLLVSFVTSIATGIVAVSLMNQAPAGVTQTINQVVERTIERVVSDPTPQPAAVAATIQETFPQIIERVSQSVVHLKPRGSTTDSVTGLGIILTKEGVVVTDKATLATSSDMVAVFSDGKEFPVQVIQSQILGDVAFLAAIAPPTYVFHPASIKDHSSLKVGETVYSLSGKDSPQLEQGILTAVPTEEITTSIFSQSLLGRPLFTTSGDVVGVKTFSLASGGSFASLYPLKLTAPTLTR